MANVIFMDGFDAYDTNNSGSSRPGVHSKWVITMGDGLYFSGGRYGGQSVRFGNSVFGYTTLRGYFEGNTFYQTATFATAVLYNNIAAAEAHGKCFTVMHDQGEQFSWDVTNIGQPRLWRGNTLVAQGVPNIFKTNDWHYVEMEYVGHTSQGRATLFVDGVEVLEFRGNTQAQAPYGFNGIQIRGGNGSLIYMDDLYIIDEATRIGERRIETLRPNGDISGNQFVPSAGTDSFAMLNENLVSADNYVTANTVGSKDLYNFTNLSTTPNRIDAVQLSVWASKTDAETRRMQTIVKSGATETLSKEYNLPTNHLNMNRIENKDPATNQAWTPNAVNALQGGFRISQ